ncbi:hypothetical protein DsansV1_C23g0180281 [Dioscorea sansibarensis]
MGLLLLGYLRELHGDTERATERPWEIEGEMDPKSLAKSKRKHGHQHRKKPQSSAASKTSRNLSDVLPSNRDRYSDEEDDDLGTETVVAAKIPGEVLPKSKGADFGWLLEQARSQPDEHRGADSQCSSSDVIPVDFMHGMSSLLLFRGSSLLSLVNDDNFVVDDDSASSFEVPFLSLDLHALATQLSKLKRSQRLFIEDDLLSEELDGSCESEGSKASEQSARLKCNEGQHDLSTLASPSHVHSKRDEHMESVDSFHGSVDCKTAWGAEVENLEIDQLSASPAQVTQSEPNEDLKPVDDFGVREVQQCISELNLHIDQPKHSKFDGFEATAAEAELDILLDSFDGNNLSTSNGVLSHSFTVKTPDTSSLNSVVPSPMKSSHSSLSTVIPTSLDEALDDLLVETSHLQGPQKEGAVSSINLPPWPASGLRPMDDDFDSWLGTL